MFENNKFTLVTSNTDTRTDMLQRKIQLFDDMLSMVIAGYNLMFQDVLENIRKHISTVRFTIKTNENLRILISKQKKDYVSINVFNL